MIDRQLGLVGPDAVGQRHADAKIGGDHRPVVICAHPRKRRRLGVQFPSFGPLAIGRAVAEHSNPGPRGSLDLPTLGVVVYQQAAQPGLFVPRQIGAVDQPVGQRLGRPRLGGGKQGSDIQRGRNGRGIALGRRGQRLVAVLRRDHDGPLSRGDRSTECDSKQQERTDQQAGIQGAHEPESTQPYPFLPSPSDRESSIFCKWSKRRDRKSPRPRKYRQTP